MTWVEWGLLGVVVLGWMIESNWMHNRDPKGHSAAGRLNR